MIRFGRETWTQLAAFAICGASLSGCAIFGVGEGAQTSSTAPELQRAQVEYGDGFATIHMGSTLGPVPGGKLIPRVVKQPVLQIKPGDDRMAAEADGVYQPGWSIENKGKSSGVVFDGRRLDPSGVINQELLKQALARMGRETFTDATSRIAVVDFSLPANKPRWFFVDLKTGAVTAEFVSHGHAKRLCHSGGCGSNTQAGFSLNTPAVSANSNTDATSLGLYKVLETKDGGGKFIGPKVVLAGLDASNATALQRGIIIHQNPRYFDPKRGLFGRSQGCFVFGPDDINTVVQYLAPGSLIYAGMSAKATVSAVSKSVTSGMN